MPLGFPGATTISSLLCAKTCGVPAVKPSPFSLSMFVVSADAKTSAGAPCSICVTSVGVPAKLDFIVTAPAVSKSLPRALNASVRDAAAKTETVPVGAVEGVPLPTLLPQAARRTAAPTSASRLPIRIPSAARQLNHNAGCLHGRDRNDSRFQPELVRGLTRDDRHDPVRPRLHLDLRGDAVLDDASDDPNEPVAGRFAGRRRRIVAGGFCPVHSPGGVVAL